MAHTIGINERARTGFAKAPAYDQHRPAYSPTIVQHLLENLGASGRKNARILDLASGTGKFTEALVTRSEQYDIVAVEPLESMREVLIDKDLPRVTVKDGRGEDIPLESGSIDAVICAQVGSCSNRCFLHLSLSHSCISHRLFHVHKQENIRSWTKHYHRRSTGE